MLWHLKVIQISDYLAVHTALIHHTLLCSHFALGNRYRPSHPNYLSSPDFGHRSTLTKAKWKIFFHWDTLDIKITKETPEVRSIKRRREEREEREERSWKIMEHHGSSWNWELRIECRLVMIDPRHLFLLVSCFLSFSFFYSRFLSFSLFFV